MSDGAMRAAVFAALGKRWFYGWTILAVAGLGIFATGPGQSHTFSVFVGPIGADLGLSKASISSAYGLATLLAAFCLPYMGRLVDRFGPRRMTTVVVLLLGAACLAFGAVASLLWLAVGFAALRFLAQGSLMLTCANLVSQWFSRRRGFALSLMALGFAVSMAVHPPLGQYLIETIGWRRAGVVLGVPLPAGAPAAGPPPRSARPSGGGGPGGEARPGGRAAPPVSGLTLRETLGTSAFYILGAGWFAIAMLVTTLHFYQEIGRASCRGRG